MAQLRKGPHRGGSGFNHLPVAHWLRADLFPARPGSPAGRDKRFYIRVGRPPGPPSRCGLRPSPLSKDDGPVFVRPQKHGQRFFRPPAAPPGGLNGKMQGALDIAGHEFPVLAGVNQEKTMRFLLITRRQFLGSDETITAAFGFLLGVRPGGVHRGRQGAVLEIQDCPTDRRAIRVSSRFFLTLMVFPQKHILTPKPVGLPVLTW